MLTSGLAAGANLILNAFLIPPLGALGAAAATAASYALCFVSRLADTHRMIKFKMHILRFLINTGLVSFACFALYINLLEKAWIFTVSVFIAVCIINMKSLFGIIYIIIKRFRRKPA